nr:hypothetical protein [Tanacetum cinerariifolium]GEV39846.1 hypothetical protein [Tanacetum cinerariifolium]
MIVTHGEGSANPTEPHHTPSPQEHHSPQHDSPPLSHPTIISEPIIQAPTDTLTPRRLTRRAIRIAQSKAISPAADEPASLSRDDRKRKAFPTVSSLDAGQDRENIAKTSAMPHDSSPKVTSLDADEGNMQQRIHELIKLCKSQVSRGQGKKTCRAYSRGCSNHRGIIEIEEELGANKSTKLGSNNTEEMVNVLSSMEAVNILSSRGATASVSPADVFPTVGVPTVSGSFPTVSENFTIASVVAREMEEEFVRENHRLSQKLARNSEIARIHAEEELKIMIEGLDRSNEVIANHLREYEQAEADLSVGEKIELISELVKYQDHRAKILKYQSQQSKPLSKKEQREFYMCVLRSHAGWKTKHFRGLTLEQLKEKCIPVWKQFEDFVPMMMQLVPLEEVYIEALQVKHPIIDWEIHSEGKREYCKIIRLGGHTTVYQFFVDMLKQFNREDLHQLWTLVKETFSIKQAIRDNEKELWVEIKRLFVEDQLWIHHQAFMHDLWIGSSMIHVVLTMCLLKIRRYLYGGGGVMVGVGEGKVHSIGGMGGGSLAIRSMVSNEGLGGEGLVVDGGRAGGGEDNSGGVVMGVSKILLGECLGEEIGVSDEVVVV